MEGPVGENHSVSDLLLSYGLFEPLQQIGLELESHQNDPFELGALRDDVRYAVTVELTVLLRVGRFDDLSLGLLCMRGARQTQHQTKNDPTLHRNTFRI